MPELPEVEHTRRNLTRWMQHARIAHVTTTDGRIVRPESTTAFVQAVAGHDVLRVERRGKWLRIVLDRGMRVFAHLGMSGWFYLSRRHDQDGPMRFERVGFDLVTRGKAGRGKAKQRHVSYVDPRRWGRLIVVRKGHADISQWAALGPDPLNDGVDLAALKKRLERLPRSTIKEALMNQGILAGIGNIHAMEALWKAKIDPRSIARMLDTKQLAAIVSGLRWTIQRAILDLAKVEKEKGSQDDSRLGVHDDNPFLVYGRRGEPCPRCKEPLSRIVLGGRSTTFCPGCQTRVGRVAPARKKKATKKRASPKKRARSKKRAR